MAAAPFKGKIPAENEGKLIIILEEKGNARRCNFS
jgi:hypothetical protein